jgi:hypothetical protein
VETPTFKQDSPGVEALEKELLELHEELSKVTKSELKPILVNNYSQTF